MTDTHIPLKLTAAEAEPESSCAYLVANERGALARVFDYRMMGLASEHAKRLAAAWNLVEGIPTADIEGKTLADYVAGQAFLANAGPIDDGFRLQFNGMAMQMFAAARPTTSRPRCPTPRWAA